MITETILGFFKTLVVAVFELLPSMSTPGWFAGIGATVTSALGYLGGMGAWIPLALVGDVFTFILVCVGIGFLIKLTRIVVSFLLAGGGSAG